VKVSFGVEAHLIAAETEHAQVQKMVAQGK
jgi:hypothetical protein